MSAKEMLVRYRGRVINVIFGGCLGLFLSNLIIGDRDINLDVLLEIQIIVLYVLLQVFRYESKKRELELQLEINASNEYLLKVIVRLELESKMNNEAIRKIEEAIRKIETTIHENEEAIRKQEEAIELLRLRE